MNEQPDHAAVLRQWEKDWRKAGYHPNRYEPLEAGAEALERSCGCIVCTCEDETQCQGCGAKECEYHGKIRKERDELHAENERLRSELKEARAMIPAQIIEIDEDGAVHETQDVPVLPNPGGTLEEFKRERYEARAECVRLRHRIAALKAENERLREWLKTISELCHRL